MEIIEHITKYIDKIKIGYPIFTDELFAYVNECVPGLKKPVFNEYVLRYLKKHPTVKRYKKGIYYNTVETPFGMTKINYAELIKRAYLVEGDKVIGYETGPSYMQKIGLTTQIPAHTYIVTKRNRVKVFYEKDNIYLFSPIVEINNNNYRYLQFLDVLCNRFKVNIEADNAEEIYRNYIDNYKLNFVTLLAYARNYNNNKLLQNVADLARGI